MGWTYNTLKAALQDWTEDDNVEFVGQLDRIISLGENKATRDLDFEVFDTVKSVNLVAGTSQVAKPSDYMATRSFHVETYDGSAVYLEQRTFDYVMDYNRDPGSWGIPKYWCELDEDRWQVAPIPESSFCGKARIIQRPDGLSQDNPETWLSKHLPDALLYACLLHAEEYLKADERIPVWRQRYNAEVIPAARNELRSLLRKDYSPQTSVEG